MLRLRWILLFLLLLLAGALRSRDLTAPFDTEFEGWQGGFFSIAAHHVNERGLDQVGLYPILNSALPPHPTPQNYLIYSNHPPGIPLLNALFAMLFGEHEWVLRLPHLLGSMATVLLVYILGLRVIGVAGTMIAAAMCATLPGLAFYGTLVNYENLTLPLMMVAVWAHLRWSDKGRVRDALLFTLCLFVAVSADWPGAFLLPVFIFERLLPRGGLSLRRRLRSAFFAILTGAVAVAGAVLLHQWLLRESLAHLGLTPEQAEVQPMADRLGVLLDPIRSGMLGAWAVAQARHIGSLVQWDVFLLGVLGLILCLMPFRRSERARIVILPGFIAGLGYLLAFAKHSMDQTPFWIYTLPFLCLAFGFICFRCIALVMHGMWTRRLTAIAVTVPFMLFNLQRWSELREEYRHDPPTRRVGRVLREQTPEDMILYVPEACGWNFAYDYYARRYITRISPDTALKACPQAAYRDLDTPGETIMAIADQLVKLHKLGFLNPAHGPNPPYRSGVLLPKHPETEAIREQAEAIEHILASSAACEQVDLEGFRMLVFEPPDLLGQGLYLSQLREDPRVHVRLRADLQAIAHTLPGADVIYVPQLETYGYKHVGPLRAAGKWFYFLPLEPEWVEALLNPEDGSDHALELGRLPGGAARERAFVIPAAREEIGAFFRQTLSWLPPFVHSENFLHCRLKALNPLEHSSVGRD